MRTKTTPEANHTTPAAPSEQDNRSQNVVRIISGYRNLSLATVGAIAAMLANFTIGVERVKEDTAEADPEAARPGDA
jgi:hypothetical protein